MNVFEFIADGYKYGIAAQTFEEAEQFLFDEYADTYESHKEIPKSEWDKPFITMYEDNDTTTEPFILSINDVLSSNEPQILYSTDDCVTGW